ncbi:Ankyrin repeat protein 1 [Giardia muris]|uniref:Ankyrin repeat protein 1 n=1 Tax=Giardia muris TaxID=5742 RepID=A0A4Z1SWX4_GIAMU|nr:Ankyrin repeat protein 1 [Giardia muris]|eukprot:TNJ26223.1 Ankyrin repeat protein 1 [Giardia muris]
MSSAIGPEPEAGEIQEVSMEIDDVAGYRDVQAPVPLETAVDSSTSHSNAPRDALQVTGNLDLESTGPRVTQVSGFVQQLQTLSASEILQRSLDLAQELRCPALPYILELYTAKLQTKAVPSEPQRNLEDLALIVALQQVLEERDTELEHAHQGLTRMESHCAELETRLSSASHISPTILSKALESVSLAQVDIAKWMDLIPNLYPEVSLALKAPVEALLHSLNLSCEGANALMTLLIYLQELDKPSGPKRVSECDIEGCLAQYAQTYALLTDQLESLQRAPREEPSSRSTDYDELMRELAERERAVARREKECEQMFAKIRMLEERPRTPEPVEPDFVEDDTKETPWDIYLHDMEVIEELAGRIQQAVAELTPDMTDSPISQVQCEDPLQQSLDRTSDALLSVLRRLEALAFGTEEGLVEEEDGEDGEQTLALNMQAIGKHAAMGPQMEEAISQATETFHPASPMRVLAKTPSAESSDAADSVRHMPVSPESQIQTLNAELAQLRDLLRLKNQEIETLQEAQRFGPADLPELEPRSEPPNGNALDMLAAVFDEALPQEDELPRLYHEAGTKLARIAYLHGVQSDETRARAVGLLRAGLDKLQDDDAVNESTLDSFVQTCPPATPTAPQGEELALLQAELSRTSTCLEEAQERCRVAEEGCRDARRQLLEKERIVDQLTEDLVEARDIAKREYDTAKSLATKVSEGESALADVAQRLSQMDATLRAKDEYIEQMHRANEDLAEALARLRDQDLPETRGYPTESEDKELQAGATSLGADESSISYEELLHLLTLREEENSILRARIEYDLTRDAMGTPREREKQRARSRPQSSRKGAQVSRRASTASTSAAIPSTLAASGAGHGRKETVVTLRSQLQAMEKNNSHLQLELTAANAKLVQARSAEVALKRVLHEKNKDLEQLKQSVLSLTQKTDRHIRKISTLENDKCDLLARLVNATYTSSDGQSRGERPLRQLRSASSQSSAGSPYTTPGDRRLSSERSGEASHTPLMLAVLQDDLEGVRSNLKYSGHRLADGTTAMMLAASENRIDAIKLLLPKEARMRRQDGATALSLALAQNNIEAAQLLVELEGIDTSTINRSGTRKTELMTAAEENDLVSIYCLIPLQGGLRDADGRTALMYAADTGRFEAARLLREKEAKIQSRHGETALMRATQRGFIDIVRLLYDREWGLYDSEGTTALMIAARFNRPEIVSLLIDREAGMVTKRVHEFGLGFSALMTAAYYGSIECVRLLLPKEEGIKQPNGRNALSYANSDEVWNLIRQYRKR